ncbi:hypothetical protein CCAX7_59520 [Capsulimonas corticalis]|jgi:hypothetical protein|uniref:Uncharacterized protein n=1 Tax=Capsulimonas corticalis TaxID=2219043 RepID=A0A402CZM9_9BACT|nr:hypothetical protein [Capsulimonas corticalis]BDI33901.1 hypothetical protein CCAX7_59520 [Capsulimonas corticalis]
MAKITTVTVSYRVKMSYDYQTVEGGAEMTIQLEEGELASTTIVEYRRGLRVLVNADVKKELRAAVRESKALFRE